MARAERCLEVFVFNVLVRVIVVGAISVNSIASAIVSIADIVIILVVKNNFW